jgi:hypothetical protein
MQRSKNVCAIGVSKTNINYLTFLLKLLFHWARLEDRSLLGNFTKVQEKNLTDSLNLDKKWLVFFQHLHSDPARANITIANQGWLQMYSIARTQTDEI